MEATPAPSKGKSRRRFVLRFRSSRKSKSFKKNAEASSGTSTPPPERPEDEAVTPPLTPVEEKEDSGPPPAPTRRPPFDHTRSMTKHGVPVISSINADAFRPSDVREDDIIYPNSEKWEDDNRDGDFGNSAVGDKGSAAGADAALESPRSSRRSRRVRETVVLNRAPTARESAFVGPPRYDWIDIETAAAVKVQAAYRRNKVMWELEKQGLSTAAMRNRRRQRKARKNLAASEDVPKLCGFCGVGLLFGDATEEELEMQKAREKEEFEERRRQREAHEEQKRKFRMRKKKNDRTYESVEVVE